MCREKIQSAVLASYADELERSKLPGYVSRYDDLDAEYELPFDPAAPGAEAGGPPLRRGPLRGHTQHTRGSQSVLRGPHVSPRSKESSAEGIASERGEPGFASGL
jgi:stage V sporulation protein G